MDSASHAKWMNVSGNMWSPERAVGRAGEQVNGNAGYTSRTRRYPTAGTRDVKPTAQQSNTGTCL